MNSENLLLISVNATGLLPSVFGDFHMWVLKGDTLQSVVLGTVAQGLLNIEVKWHR